jgi:malate synthase
VGIGYMNGWNQDIGCVAWDNLMEDLATLEISRAQTWQWLHHQVTLEDGRTVTRELIASLFDEELNKILDEVREAYKGMADTQLNAVLEGFKKAAADAQHIFTARELSDFLTNKSDLA